MKLPALILLATLNVANSQGCVNYASTRHSFCYDLFSRLQEQITGNDANLYSLRKVFYPTSHAEPTLVNVSYDLHVSASENISCSGDPESEENPRYDYMPDKLLQLLKVHAWSSKVFYTLFHPATINRLQPQVLQNVLSEIDSVDTQLSAIATALTWNTTGPILTVELCIDLKLPCLPTFLALEGSLYDLTSFLKVYAKTQANLSSWDDKEKGYTLFGNVFIDGWWLSVDKAYPSSNDLPYVNFLLSVILTLVVCYGVHYAIWNIAPATSDQKNFRFYHIVTWCGVVLLLQLNITFLYFEIKSIWSWCDYKMSCQERAAKSKIGLLLWMTLYIILSFIALVVYFNKRDKQRQDIFKPEWRAFVFSNPYVSLVALILFCLFKLMVRLKKIKGLWVHLQNKFYGMVCHNGMFKTVLERMIQFIAAYVLYVTVFVSASIFSFSLLPILLQTFLYPFRIVAVYSLFFSSLAVYAVASFVATFLWKEKPPTTKKLLFCLSLPVTAGLIINFASVPFISLYKILVTGSLSDNPLVLFGASVLPSLLLSSPLVWLLRSKFMGRFVETEEQFFGLEQEEDKSDMVVNVQSDTCMIGDGRSDMVGNGQSDNMVVNGQSDRVGNGQSDIDRNGENCVNHANQRAEPVDTAMTSYV